MKEARWCKVVGKRCKRRNEERAYSGTYAFRTSDRYSLIHALARSGAFRRQSLWGEGANRQLREQTIRGQGQRTKSETWNASR